MKPLQTILTESILGPEGPRTLEDNEMALAIYSALESLPKADDIIFDRLVYKSAEVGKKFCKTIMDCADKLIRTDDLKPQKRINVYAGANSDYPSGVAIHKNRGGLITLVVWDTNYFIIASEEHLPESNSLQADYTEYWAILSTEGSKYHVNSRYSSYFKDMLWGGGPYYYIPYPVSMALVKKICDAKR